jgi:hypothetical protein
MPSGTRPFLAGLIDGKALAVAFALGGIGAAGAACDAARFDEERVAAPASYDARGGEIVSQGDPVDDARRIAELCPHGHVLGTPRKIVVAVQLVPHPIGESSPVARDRIPIFERRLPFTCTLPPVLLDAGGSPSSREPKEDAATEEAGAEDARGKDAGNDAASLTDGASATGLAI